MRKTCFLLLAIAACKDPATHPSSREISSGNSAKDAELSAVYLQSESEDSSALLNASVVESPVLDARLLVVSADGKESELGAIKSLLNRLGTPFSILKLSTLTPGPSGNRLKASQFANGGHAFYQGVILTNGTLNDLLTEVDWNTLKNFEASYHLRQVVWFAQPSYDLGFNMNKPITQMNTEHTPLNASLAGTAGTNVWLDVNAATNAVTIKDALVYRAKPRTDGKSITVLKDSRNNALGLIRNYSDGRQNLTLTFSSSIDTLHTLQLGYGLINWVTRGIFIGERHAYLGPQVDDIFFFGDLYGGGLYRTTPADLNRVVAWQDSVRANAKSAAFTIDLVFNGKGVNLESDPLSKRAKELQANFRWINHTFGHLDLDTATYNATAAQVTKNNDVAAVMGFTNYDPRNLVTGAITGLRNRKAMKAAFDNGVRFIVSDTSRPEQNNPTFNTGIPNARVSGIFQIPRKPVNIFYQASNPTQQTTLYNDLYREELGRDLTYAEIINVESESILVYMLTWNIDPLMFHQNNLRAYDDTHSLISDLMDDVLKKYRWRMNLPLASLPMHVIGQRMMERDAFNASGVTAKIVPGQSITLNVVNGAVIPVTGANVSGAESYGGQLISRTPVKRGTPVTLSINTAQGT